MPAPTVNYENGLLSWPPVEGAKTYNVYRNGKLMTKIPVTNAKLTLAGYNSYQVTAVDKNNVESFASEPIEVMTASLEKRYEAEAVTAKANYEYKGFTGEGFVEISKEINAKLIIPITVDEAGLYSIDFRYANGNGPTNTENKCAIRTLSVDNKNTGTVVLPQRGKGEWSNWGFTNSVMVSLQPGKHTVTLSFEAFNENMNGKINQAMLDYMRVVKIK